MSFACFGGTRLVSCISDASLSATDFPSLLGASGASGGVAAYLASEPQGKEQRMVFMITRGLSEENSGC